MPWRRSWREIKAPAPASENNLYYRLKKEIPAVRAQGEPPVRDPGSFSRFTCELCTTANALAELKQCVLCGRWVCSSCWTSDYYVCNSCHGVIKLNLLG